MKLVVSALAVLCSAPLSRVFAGMDAAHNAPEEFSRIIAADIPSGRR